METSQIIKQDVKAVFLSLQSDDYGLMSVYSNRIMSDTLFDRNPNPNYALIGFLFREIAIIGGNIKNNKENTAYSTAKSIIANYVESTVVDSTSQKLWNDFANCYNRVRKYEEDKYETESYQNLPEFTQASFVWLSELLNKERNLLFDANSQFVTGIATEMERIIRVYGGELHEVCVVALFKSLNLLFSYVNYFEKDKRKEILEKLIFPHLDSVFKVVQMKETDFNQVTDVLSKIVFDWRLHYIQFLERPKITFERPKITIAEETKKKLSDSIGKVLEEEVK